MEDKVEEEVDLKNNKNNTESHHQKRDTLSNCIETKMGLLIEGSLVLIMLTGLLQDS